MMYHVTFTRANLNLFRSYFKLKIYLSLISIVVVCALIVPIYFNSFIYFQLLLLKDLMIILILFIFILIFKFLKLPQPNKYFVNRIFGPEKFPSGSSDLQNESACNCHAYDTDRKGFKRTFRKRNSITSLQEGDHNRDFLNFIVGHRGAGMNSPENSLSGIRKCKKRGCSIIEFDVSLTKDKVPVLFHDDNLLRVMGDERKLSDITWEELKGIDISEKFPGEKVPTLEEAVDLCLSLRMRFIIDIKDEDDELVDSIVTIFQRYGEAVYSLGVVSSFYFRVVYKIRSRDPNIVGCMAWRPSFFALPHDSSSKDLHPLSRFLSKLLIFLMYFANDFAMKYIYWKVLGLSAVLVHKDALNMELIYNLQNKGLRVYAWTVNCPTEKRYFLNKLQIGYLTDTLDIEDYALPAPETWLSNNNNEEYDRAL